MKKQTLTFIFFLALFLLLIMLANSLVPVPVSNEEAIMRYLQQNFGDSKTAWLDTIDSIQTSGTTVIVTTSKTRHNDAIDMCEAVAMFLFAPASKMKLTDIQIVNSGKVLIRRSGVNDHCQ